LQSKNVSFHILTFDLNCDQPCETARAGPEKLPPLKLVVVGVVESGEVDALDNGCLKGWPEG